MKLGGGWVGAPGRRWTNHMGLYDQNAAHIHMKSQKWKEEQNIVLHKKCIKVECHNEIYFCECYLRHQESVSICTFISCINQAKKNDREPLQTFHWGKECKRHGKIND